MSDKTWEQYEQEAKMTRKTLLRELQKGSTTRMVSLVSLVQYCDTVLALCVMHKNDIEKLQQ